MKRKLLLSKETLGSLSRNQLEKVPGGLSELVYCAPTETGHPTCENTCRLCTFTYSEWPCG
jgi:hypothetical protein